MYPYSRMVNHVQPHDLNYYGPIMVAVDRHKNKRMCKAYRNS